MTHNAPQRIGITIHDFVTMLGRNPSTNRNLAYRLRDKGEIELAKIGESAVIVTAASVRTFCERRGIPVPSGL